VGGHEAHESHAPIDKRLERLIGRGQDTGAFDRRLSPTWLLAAMVGLLHAAHEEVAAGRMTTVEAAPALEYSILRVFGAESGPAQLTGMPMASGSRRAK